MSAAHRITARGNLAVVRGYWIGCGRLQTDTSRLQIRPNPRQIKGLETVEEPFVSSGTAIARVHSVVRCAHFAAAAVCLQPKTAKLDAAIALSSNPDGLTSMLDPQSSKPGLLSSELQEARNALLDQLPGHLPPESEPLASAIHQTRFGNWSWSSGAASDRHDHPGQTQIPAAGIPGG